ncbi:MAG: hypothetical protein ACRDTX_09145 [Pseudonocardiaceae bacterium]
MVDTEIFSILSVSDLAMVLLIRADGSGRAMPTVELSKISAVVEELVDLGIPAVKVFASGDARNCTGSRGKAPGSLMARAIGEVKEAHSSMIVMTETCLCSYTDSGECHLIDRTGHPDQLATIEAIAEQAVAQATAGADVVGPAAMINGSVSCVRQALEDTGHSEVQIMPHLIFDSRLYDAYRQTMDAIPTSGERRVFQIDPAQPETALRASLGFVDEGADMLLLEPALFCADVLTALKQACQVPIAPFSVSGEYLKLRSEGDSPLLVELFTMLKRSGADQIITYAAADIARSIR